MQPDMVGLSHKIMPHRVTTEEVKESLEWLDQEYASNNTFLGSQRSEVKESRFVPSQEVHSIEDADILRKFREAKTLDIHTDEEDTRH